MTLFRIILIITQLFFILFFSYVLIIEPDISFIFGNTLYLYIISGIGITLSILTLSFVYFTMTVIRIKPRKRFTFDSETIDDPHIIINDRINLKLLRTTCKIFGIFIILFDIFVFYQLAVHFNGFYSASRLYIFLFIGGTLIGLSHLWYANISKNNS